MTSFLESLQSSTCVWFEIGNKRNVLVSMFAGTLFFVGWWFIIDAHAKYPNEMAKAYHVCGIFGTISLFMINSVTNAQMRGDALNGGYLGARGARGWLFIGFVMGFAAVIAACWILFADFVAAGAQHHWPGVGLFLQNMKPNGINMSIIWLLLITIVTFIDHSNGIAVMSIDIGSESMKVAIVSPGVPMEIALNKESKRKTPVTIAFRNGERSFGEDAQVVGIRSPQNSFSYILDLLGKYIDNPIVELYKKRFPYYDIISDEERKEFAENSAGQKITADLAGIKVLQLINDYTAVALNYGIFRTSSTTATIVSYQNVKTKEKGFIETNPHVTILAKEFDALNKTKNSVFSNNVLSANTDHFAQIEGLIDERVTNPIKIALKTSGLTMDAISQVVLVGAATRMPKIQEHLSQYLTIELSKNINTDEAAVLGAVYKAADLSKGFKVKKFITKDAVLFPIHIVFDRTVNNRIKQVKKSLFNKMNPYPQKKIITFNKYTENFQFHINYAELDYLPFNEIAAIGNFNLSTITLSGITEALDKHLKDGAESKGIKAHFAMDESGILNLVNVELVSEKSSLTPDEEESTFSILGSTISKLFAGLEDKEGKSEESLKEDIKPVHEESEYSELQKETEDKMKKKNDSMVTEDNKIVNKTEKIEKEKEKKATIVTIKEPIKADEIKLGSQILSGDKLVKSQAKLHRLDVYDFEKTKRETALNNLETFIIDAQQKLESEEYATVATSQEAESILKACSEISEWLYEDGFSVTAEIYEEKLSYLQKLTNDVYERVYEHRERPEALKGMTSIEIFTQIEIETLEKVINETQEYYNTIIKSFTETALYEPVKYKVRDIVNKMALLDREVNYLINKAKIWRPKQESTTNHTESINETATNSKEGPESDSKTESQTENLQNENPESAEVQNENTQEEIHQEL
ncbi:Hypoxia up-regulated protein [Apis cerana cerana]|uniref:Hypoxia up-regulated protein 1 n=1 Tax=Apis cerana cerana TaxID=94128 RepID=A0A2A3ECW0_APICC|nr:Hypoxia up-regulated protein [Apis cerana cerana]